MAEQRWAADFAAGPGHSVPGFASVHYCRVLVRRRYLPARGQGAGPGHRISATVRAGHASHREISPLAVPGFSAYLVAESSFPAKLAVVKGVERPVWADGFGAASPPGPQLLWVGRMVCPAADVGPGAASHLADAGDGRNV